MGPNWVHRGTAAYDPASLARPFSLERSVVLYRVYAACALPQLSDRYHIGEVLQFGT